VVKPPKFAFSKKLKLNQNKMETRKSSSIYKSVKNKKKTKTMTVENRKCRNFETSD
jgi:hypothetical protein